MPEIKHEVWKCIGCYACESAAPSLFKIKEKDGEVKAELLGSKAENTKEGRLEKKSIDKKDLEKAKEAESVCPVSCIHVKE